MNEKERIEEERFIEALISLWIQPDAPEWITDHVRTELKKQRGLLALDVAKGTCKGIKSGGGQFADMPTLQFAT